MLEDKFVVFRVVDLVELLNCECLAFELLTELVNEVVGIVHRLLELETASLDKGS